MPIPAASTNHRVFKPLKTHEKAPSAALFSSLGRALFLVSYQQIMGKVEGEDGFAPARRTLQVTQTYRDHLRQRKYSAFGGPPLHPDESSVCVRRLATRGTARTL